MGKVIVLEKLVADKIAAGEVVERPASVVKELLENSLDAKATHIEIHLSKGGHEEIHIIDNGHGMSGDDALIAIKRFATSKIKEWEDIANLHTFGFRGEALPSILAVSRTEIQTREKDSETGTLIEIEGGIVEETRDTGCPQGTRIKVKDIFFNTPARRKFLKSPSAETAHVVGIAQKLSLVNPDCGFKLTSNGREIFNYPPNMSIKERILNIWGLPLDYEIIPIENESSSVRISGFICKPDKLKSHRSYQLFFVNNRFVKNPMLNQAVAEGFSPLLQAGKFPMALIFVDLLGEEVDINVHPNKMEVRFFKPGEIFRLVRDAIKRELRSFGYDTVLPEAETPKQLSEELLQAREVVKVVQRPAENLNSRQYDSNVKLVKTSYFRGDKKVREDRYEYTPVLPMDVEIPSLNSIKPRSSQMVSMETGFRALTQINKTYIVGQMKNEIWVIDQHTAHERINYERLSHMGKDLSRKQSLMFPHNIELPSTLFNFLADKKMEFEEIGIEIEPFGKNTYLVRTIPFGFDKLDNEETLHSIFEEVAQGQPYTNLEAVMDKIRATIACRASVKAGDELSIDEMNAIVEEFIKMDYSSYCPHGRPVVIKLSGEHFDRMFHRM